MRARATILAALAAAAVLVVSACGSAGAAGSTALGGAASLAPADAVSFIAVDSNMSSGQWDALDTLLDKFPQRDELLARFRAGFQQKTGVDWTAVEPALGDELDVVGLPGTEKRVVALTQPHDQAKLDAALRKAGAVSRRLGGWTAFAETGAALDTFAAAQAKLADVPAYRAATAKLADDALVHAYAKGTPPDNPQAIGSAWSSADVVAAGDGLRAHVYIRDAFDASVPPNRRPAPTQPYPSHLVDEIPSGVLAVADTVVRQGQFETIDTTKLPQRIQQLLRAQPLLTLELDSIFGGETAVYLRRGLLLPELTIVTQPGDTHAAVAALGELLKALRTQPGFAQLRFVHDVIGGQLVVSTSQKGIEDFRSAGGKLSGDSMFEDAQKGVAMPAQTTGFLYVDVKDALPLVRAFAPLLGLKLPPLLEKADLSALRTLAAYGSRTPEVQVFTVYLQIR